MIESLFSWERLRELHRAAPLYEERQRYLSYLMDHGVSRVRVRTIACILLHIIRLLELEKMRSVSQAEIERAGALWMTDSLIHSTRKAGPSSFKHFRQSAVRWFRFHDALIPIASTDVFDLVLAKYLMFLRAERRASETIRGHRSQLLYFFEWLRSRGLRISTLTVGDMTAYLAMRREALRLRSFSAVCKSMRKFFLYAELQGWTSAKIAGVIQNPRIRRYEREPKGPAWSDVKKLLAGTRADSHKEIRAKAVLLLFSIYALRVSEVSNLTLDDFDWVNETFTIRRAKRGRIQQFPIQLEVGDAIIYYLRNARPVSKCRNLFITMRPPHRRAGTQTLTNIVAAEMKRHGIDVYPRGPHALRHACATELLRRGSSLREIADFLGHRDLRSVSIYAKYDMKSLRRVANKSLAGLR